MKTPKKQNATLGYLFAASLLIPTAGIVYAADETTIEKEISSGLSTSTEATEDASESLLDTAKEKLNALVGSDDDSTTEASAEQSIETAKESQEAASDDLLDTAKEELNALTDKDESNITEATADAETEIKQQAQTEESSEPGFFDKIKSKVQELTSSDTDEKVTDEQFVSE